MRWSFNSHKNQRMQAVRGAYMNYKIKWIEKNEAHSSL